MEVENVLRILKETKKAIQENNSYSLKQLSNQTIHSASTKQDEDSISIAVTIYSLGKIYEREDYKSLKGWENFNNIIILSLENSIRYLETKELENYQKNFKLIGKAINKISGKLRTYINDVFEKAKISKASRIYEHGISLSKTATLLGVSLYDLASYTGKTGISEMQYNKTLNPKQRIKIAEEFFK